MPEEIEIIEEETEPVEPVPQWFLANDATEANAIDAGMLEQYLKHVENADGTAMGGHVELTDGRFAVPLTFQQNIQIFPPEPNIKDRRGRPIFVDAILSEKQRNERCVVALDPKLIKAVKEEKEEPIKGVKR